MTRAVAAWCGVVFVVSAAGAVEQQMDRRAIEEAVYIGQSRIDIQRSRFHEPYRVQVSIPPVDWVDVITPFHRVELAAEAAARNGQRTFGQREARALLSKAPDELDLLVEMTFHPLNTFVGMPQYDVVVVKADGQRVQPRRIDRYPRFGPRTDTPGPVLPDPSRAVVLGGGQPILGGTIVASFDLTRLDTTGRSFVVVLEGTNELARSALDLARLR